MNLFDSHCHLQDERIYPLVAQIIQRALEKGVNGFLCCGSAENDWEVVEQISKTYNGVVPAFGVHPWYVKERSENWKDILVEFLRRNPNAGIGEAGLDVMADGFDTGVQETILKEHLSLAAEFGRFINIHCRRAWEKLVDCLKQNRLSSPGIILHSYSGSAEMVPVLKEMGAYFSFSGSITRPNNKRGRAACKVVPPDRLLIETDSPDILPTDPALKDAQYNEPANLIYVVRCVAEIRGITPEEAAKVTSENAKKIIYNVK